MSPNPNYEAGRRFEYVRRRHWMKQHMDVSRTAGSHGAFDLICISTDDPERFITLIQCKRVQTKAQARKLIDRFKESPPYDGHSYFNQVIEVYVAETREVMSGWVS